MKAEYEQQGYKIGRTVRQCHHTNMFDDAVITNIHDNGALDVEMGGRAYGWSVNTCKPIERIA